MRTRARISQQLTMRDCCILLHQAGGGWCGEGDGEPTRRDIERLRRRLRTAEAQVRRRLLFGGGQRGRRGGGHCWTTIGALRAVGLLDDFEAMAGTVGQRVAELQDTIGELDERQRLLARTLARNQGQLCAIARKLGVVVTP